MSTTAAYTRKQALEAVEASGHTIYAKEDADAIAEALGFKYDEDDFVIMKHDPPFMHIPKELEGKKGYWQLGQDACRYWNLKNNAWEKSGRGARAHAYVCAIKKHLATIEEVL